VEYLIPETINVAEKSVEINQENQDVIQFMNDFVLIPGYSIQVSAGHGAMANTNEAPSRFLAYRKKWLQFRGFKESDLVIVWAKGDSMEPTIHNNDTIVINTSRKKPVDGHIYVIRYEDSLLVKRMQIHATSWILLSDNRAYPPLEIKLDEQSSFEIVGQVVNVSKDFGD
jgi:phage repressor protein C with HTH and peptisase S24 domain